jgi:hypothetical protein
MKFSFAGAAQNKYLNLRTRGLLCILSVQCQAYHLSSENFVHIINVDVPFSDLCLSTYHIHNDAPLE